MVLIGWWRKNQIALSVGVLVYEKREGSSLIPMGWVEVEDFVGLNLGSVVEQPWLLYFSASGFSSLAFFLVSGFMLCLSLLLLFDSADSNSFCNLFSHK